MIKGIRVSVPTGYGIPAQYHEVCAVHIYVPDRMVHVDVRGFAVEGATTPLEVRQTAFQGEEYPFDDGNFSHDRIYEELVKREPYTGAELVL